MAADRDCIVILYIMYIIILTYYSQKPSMTENTQKIMKYRTHRMCKCVCVCMFEDLRVVGD